MLCADDGDIEERILYKEKVRVSDMTDPAKVYLGWLPTGIDIATFSSRGRFRTRELKSTIVGVDVLVFSDVGCPEDREEAFWRPAKITGYRDVDQAHTVKYTDSAEPMSETMNYQKHVVFMIRASKQEPGISAKNVYEALLDEERGHEVARVESGRRIAESGWEVCLNCMQELLWGILGDTVDWNGSCIAPALQLIPPFPYPLPWLDWPDIPHLFPSSPVSCFLPKDEARAALPPRKRQKQGYVCEPSASVDVTNEDGESSGEPCQEPDEGAGGVSSSGRRLGANNPLMCSTADYGQIMLWVSEFLRHDARCVAQTSHVLMKHVLRHWLGK